MTAPVSSPSGTPSTETGPLSARRVLVAKPRGYCAGVDRAVLTVEKAVAGPQLAPSFAHVLS